MAGDSDFSWDAIQNLYDEGSTMRECQQRFGFSNGAWDRARRRGDIRPRNPGGWNREHGTRNAVKELLDAGWRNAEIAEKLGITTPTVSYHARQLGVPPVGRFANRVDWARVQAAHDAGMSVRECARTFGFHKGSWHKAVQRGAIKPRSHLIPLEKLLVVGRRTNRRHLKARLVREGLMRNHCERCGIADWQGEPLSLQLHHKNGDGLDNRLPNLALLCPNCHSQTDTYGGRNGHRRPELRLIEGGGVA